MKQVQKLKGQENWPRPLESASPIEMFSSENYLDERQDAELKRTVINFINEFKEPKGGTKKCLCVVRGNKCPRTAQENTT